MFRSATAKLTIWYVLLATCLSVLFSGIVYHLSTEELSEALRHQYTSFVSNTSDKDTIQSPDAVIQQRTQHLFSELLWLNLIVIAGSSIVGYFFARRTLEPIATSHQAQTRFIAQASHELRTPLTAMRADTEVALMEKGLTTTTRHTLQGNLRDIERLEQLTGHLLDIARYQNKTTILVPLNMSEVVQTVIKQLTHIAKRKHVRIKQNIQPVWTMGERHSLEQLVAILLDNAVKYSRKDGEVQVTLRANETTVILTVHDSGIGIPSDDLPHVFEHFYRSRNTKSDKKVTGGYGLGLPLAQEIVTVHGGKIHITSHENHGTTVSITLPLVST